MPNPRRTAYSNSQSIDNPFQNQTFWSVSTIVHFLKKPHAFPFLLSIFVFLTWVSLRLQNSSHFASQNIIVKELKDGWSKDDDLKANLVRFSSRFPSRISKDKRGWLLNPISLALDSAIKGGALNCASVHLGEIRPGAIRGNHRHHDCNETLVIWGAKTKFRLENIQEVHNGYAEVLIGADEVAVAASPSGTAHALVNVDPTHSTFFIGCQDSNTSYNSSTSDFNVWKDL